MVKRFILILLPLILVLGIFFSNTAKPDPPPFPEAKLPELVSMASYPLGGESYIACAGYRQAVEALTPMKFRVEPFALDKGMREAIRIKATEFAYLSSPELYCASHGLGLGFCERGPQPLRIVWYGGDAPRTLFVRGDSGIKSISDLKGKRVPYILGGSTWNKEVESSIAFGGLTWDDIIEVKFSSPRSAQRGILAGSVDVCLHGTGSPTAMKLEASVHGIHWLECPPDNVEGWKRFRTISPWAMPCPATSGTGIPPGTVKHMTSVVFNIIAYDFLDENIAYHVAKAVHQGYDRMKDIHSWNENATIDNALALKRFIPVPYHPGSIKYFKEIGRWTPEHEKWQSECLRLEKETIEVYKKDPKAWVAKYKGWLEPAGR